MGETASQKQQKIFDYIVEWVQKKGYPPSVREIGKAVGLNSSASVYNHLKILEKNGFIRRDAAKPRAIELLIKNPVSQNLPRHSDGNLLGPDAPAWTRQILSSNGQDLSFMNRKDVFLAQVRDENLRLWGLNAGDWAVVDPHHNPELGDVLLVKGEPGPAFMQFTGAESGGRLAAADNPQPRPVPDIDVQGAVIGVIRRFRPQS